MNKNIQKEKIKYKLNILKNHILDLIEYNNLRNYQNTKKYTIKIQYFKEKSSYNYTVFILRGTNDPGKTLTLRFNSEEKINDLIENMIKNIVINEYFSYSSFGKDYNDLNKYVINFKNNVEVEFYFDDDNDLEFYKNIDKKYQKNTIITNNINMSLTTKMKDELQRIKAIKVINNIDNIFNNIIKLNDIENYENKKPYKLLINGQYDKNKEHYMYNFYIVRGTVNPENIVEYSLSIFNNDIVLKELENLINKYMNSDNFIYKASYNSYDNIYYTINLEKDIKIDICNDIEKDNDFYKNVFKFNDNQKRLFYKK